MQGNHSAEGEGTYEICHNALIGHFPWRSYQQFENKVRNGYEAYRASTLPKEMGSHWRSYGELLENHGPDGLRSHFEEWFFDPAIELDLAPIGAEDDFRYCGTLVTPLEKKAHRALSSVEPKL